MRFMFLFCFPCICCGQDYFPGVSFDKEAEQHHLQNKWYSQHLKALAEPPMFSSEQNAKSECYRFTWLRTSHRPVALRIDISKNGSATFTIKVADGKGGYEPGKLVRNEKWVLNERMLNAFKATFNQAKFFDEPVAQSDAGLDGSQWLIEANINGRYHVVSRWMPKSGPIWKIGMTFIEIATSDFSPIK